MSQMKRGASHLGFRLRMLRLERYATLMQVGDAVGVSQSYVHRQENTETLIWKPEYLEKALNFLNELKPLAQEEVQFFRLSGHLGQWEAPTPPVVVNQNNHAESIVVSGRGQARLLLESVHRQIVDEVGSRVYLSRLISLAEDMGVDLDLTSSHARPRHDDRTESVS